MHQESWTRLSKVNDYLQAKKEAGTQSFKNLISQARLDQVELVVITFTYEKLEALGKKDGSFIMYNQLFGTLNSYEMDDLIRYDYNEENAFEDFTYTHLGLMTSEMIKVWLADCFNQASQDKSEDLHFYFKLNHDDMEIFALEDFRTIYEKSEFETFVKNNKSNQISLLGA